jgi:hypothetical protein
MIHFPEITKNLLMLPLVLAVLRNNSVCVWDYEKCIYYDILWQVHKKGMNISKEMKVYICSGLPHCPCVSVIRAKDLTIFKFQKM